MSKTFAIGDIHGEVTLMKKALNAIEKAEDGGTVVFLGDYIDRGPDSKGVLDVLMKGPPSGWKWITLRGNHDDMMYRYKTYPDWVGHWGIETLKSFGVSEPSEIPLEYFNWIERNLRYYYEDDHRVYVHAMVDRAFDLDNHPEVYLLWNRYDHFNEGGYRGKHVVHGHTPKTAPELRSGRSNLDCGAVFGNYLAVGVFDDGVPGGPKSVMTFKKSEID